MTPAFAGDTVYAWSEILDKAKLERRNDVGALRVRLVALKDMPGTRFPYKNGDVYDASVLLDLDLWVVCPV